MGARLAGCVLMCLKPKIEHLSSPQNTTRYYYTRSHARTHAGAQVRTSLCAMCFRAYVRVCVRAQAILRERVRIVSGAWPHGRPSMRACACTIEGMRVRVGRHVSFACVCLFVRACVRACVPVCVHGSVMQNPQWWWSNQHSTLDCDRIIRAHVPTRMPVEISDARQGCKDACDGGCQDHYHRACHRFISHAQHAQHSTCVRLHPRGCTGVRRHARTHMRTKGAGTHAGIYMHCPAADHVHPHPPRMRLSALACSHACTHACIGTQARANMRTHARSYARNHTGFCAHMCADIGLYRCHMLTPTRTLPAHLLIIMTIML